MRKTLILVLSALRDPWYAMLHKQRATWDSIPNEQTSTIFYVGNGYPVRFEDQVLHSATDEHLHNIGRRTVEALTFALQIPDRQYLARVHSSTYVHKRRMVEFVEALPEAGVMLGLQTPGPYDRDYLWGGGHYLMSRDVVQLLMDDQHRWDHQIMEDVAMSTLAWALGIQFGKGRSASIDWKPDLQSASCIAFNGSRGGFDFTDFKEVDTLEDQFFFRCKHDPDRSVDLRTMDLLFQNLTP